LLEFQARYAAFAQTAAGDVTAFHEGLAALCETFLWAIPSSTIDDPDVGLYDHARATAAVATCLHRHHEFAGDLADEAAVRDRERRKFRFCVGDLSGIQRALFRLRSERVRGLALLLRGRSLRFQLIVEAAVRRLLSAFELPPYAALQTAGGRFLLLLPFTREDEQMIVLDRLREKIDRWMRDEYVGDLALNLALTPPFAAADLLDSSRAAKEFEEIGLAAEEAKTRMLSMVRTESVVKLEFDRELGDGGICPACGLRPAVPLREGDVGDTSRCRACAAEARLGQRYPKAVAVEIDAMRGAQDDPFGVPIRLLERGEKSGVLGWRFRGAETALQPVGERFGVAYVAKFPENDAAALIAYREALRRDALGEHEEVDAGQVKTFSALALDSQEKDAAGRAVGRAMLAIVKADVDRLGAVFTRGLGERRSLARVAALSRLVDAFFTGFLPSLMDCSFRDLYTVYAGGDDLLVIGPWLQAMRFASELRHRFDEFSGCNPNLTLSAGIALFDPKAPVSRAADEAEERLKKAKADGRDRIHAVLPVEADAIGWGALFTALADADTISDAIRAGSASTALLYRLLSLDDRRRRADGGDVSCADWRAKLGYTLWRTLPDRDGKSPPLRERLLALFDLGGDLQVRPGQARAPARLPLTIALYRNR
jgi:CRISPR-associated protein Csm1